MALQTDQSRVYEEVQPTYEWKEEPQNNILVVHLPDFTKKQISINCVRSRLVAQVKGERQLLGNKWKRCNREFQIPQNCMIDKIEAKWHDGAITITMPKETITQGVAREEEGKTAQEAPKDHQQADSPKAAAEPEATSSIHGEKQTQGRSVDSLIAQEEAVLQNLLKGESAFSESASTTMKQTDKGSSVPKAETIDQMKGKERGKKIENIVAEFQKPENVIEKTTQVKERSFPELSEKDKEKEDKSAGEEKKKQKQKEDSISAKTMEKESIAGALMQAVKGLSMEENGDKQLVINIGVAALVLVVLGAYISYNLGLKSKD